MNDFDRFIEFELRKMLDPLVLPEAPRRRRPKGTGSPFLAVISGPIEIAADARPVLETVAVPVLRVLN
jgi:hypothetical protein